MAKQPGWIFKEGQGPQRVLEAVMMMKTPIASKSTEMETLICYILNIIRFVMLYVSPKINTKDKLEKITDVICIE